MRLKEWKIKEMKKERTKKVDEENQVFVIISNDKETFFFISRFEPFVIVVSSSGALCFVQCSFLTLIWLCLTFLFAQDSSRILMILVLYISLQVKSWFEKRPGGSILGVAFLIISWAGIIFARFVILYFYAHFFGSLYIKNCTFIPKCNLKFVNVFFLLLLLFPN